MVAHASCSGCNTASQTFPFGLVGLHGSSLQAPKLVLLTAEAEADCSSFSVGLEKSKTHRPKKLIHCIKVFFLRVRQCIPDTDLWHPSTTALVIVSLSSVAMICARTNFQ